jgi:hypothetical protein
MVTTRVFFAIGDTILGGINGNAEAASAGKNQKYWHYGAY